MPVLRKSNSAIKPKPKAKPKRVSKGGVPKIHPVDDTVFESLPKLLNVSNPRSNRVVDNSLTLPQTLPQSNSYLSKISNMLGKFSKKGSVHPSPTPGTGGKKRVGKK